MARAVDHQQALDELTGQEAGDGHVQGKLAALYHPQRRGRRERLGVAGQPERGIGRQPTACPRISDPGRLTAGRPVTGDTVHHDPGDARAVPQELVEDGAHGG
jgi:hypothetical protein